MYKRAPFYVPYPSTHLRKFVANSFWAFTCNCFIFIDRQRRTTNSWAQEKAKYSIDDNNIPFGVDPNGIFVLPSTHIKGPLNATKIYICSSSSWIMRRAVIMKPAYPVRCFIPDLRKQLEQGIGFGQKWKLLYVVYISMHFQVHYTYGPV